MKLVDKLVTRLTKSASIAVTDTVKEEAKTVAVSVLPSLLGLGFTIAGIILFKSVAGKQLPTGGFPGLSTTSVVTHNWFFDSSAQKEVIEKLIK